MHSAEPFEPSALNPIPPVAPPAADSDEWRAEVASRVSSYRARQKNRVAEQQSLGFPPQNVNSGPAGDPWRVGDPSAQAVTGETAAHREKREISRERISGKQKESVPGAFDTNYYRRLNALEQSAQTAAASVTAAAVDFAALENVAEGQIGHRADSTTARELTVDLELHAPAAGDACLDRYRINGETEPGACARTVAQPIADPQLDEITSSRPSPAQAAPAPPAPAVHGNLLVFPRPLLEPPLWAQPSRDELADPVSRPRILEVPEDIMPTVQGSLFPEIRLDTEEPEPSTRREPQMEIPLPAAPLSTRIKAGLADLAVVASGTGLFAAIAGRATPELGAKPFSLVIAVATVLFWAVYQQMFLLYAGRTVGMRITGIRLSTFDGRTPQWSERRSRVRYILISCASVALGFLWALVDEDSLCWHDRASRTFPTRK